MSNKLPKKRNNNQLCISVDSGKIEVPIIDKHTHEKLGQLVFAPNDTNIVERYEEVVSFWKNYKMPEEDSLEAVKKAFTGCYLKYFLSFSIADRMDSCTD